MSKLAYQRILLKLSGEQFAGKGDSGLDLDFIKWLALELKSVAELGAQLVVIVGAGNFIRGAELAERGVDRASGDYMGMLATIMNGMVLLDLLEHAGQQTRLQTRLLVNSVAEPFVRRRAIRHLEKGRVVIVAGGTGNPFVTTDTAAVLTALELSCDAIFKATKVDGVYDMDPVTHKDAKRFSKLTIQEAIEKPEVRVMDKSALALAQDQNIPIIVFDLLSEGNIARAAQGDPIGTTIL